MPNNICRDCINVRSANLHSTLQPPQVRFFQSSLLKTSRMHSDSCSMLSITVLLVEYGFPMLQSLWPPTSLSVYGAYSHLHSFHTCSRTHFLWQYWKYPLINIYQEQNKASNYCLTPVEYSMSDPSIASEYPVWFHEWVQFDGYGSCNLWMWVTSTAMLVFEKVPMSVTLSSGKNTESGWETTTRNPVTSRMPTGIACSGSAFSTNLSPK